jgi:uncharacterized protein
MKLHQARAPGQNLFTGYGPGYVSVNGSRREANTIVLADRVLDWPVQGFESLSAQEFAALAGLPIEILLLGTGSALQFPHPQITEPLRRAGIGFEAMDTSAACRTYNILLAEGRQVGAALLIERPGDRS